jgi:hypothetical protein
MAEKQKLSFKDSSASAKNNNNNKSRLKLEDKKRKLPTILNFLKT